MVQSRLVWNTGGLFVNILAYADDITILALSWYSWYAVQALLEFLESFTYSYSVANLIFVMPKRQYAWFLNKHEKIA